VLLLVCTEGLSSADALLEDLWLQNLTKSNKYEIRRNPAKPSAQRQKTVETGPVLLSKELRKFAF